MEREELTNEQIKYIVARLIEKASLSHQKSLKCKNDFNDGHALAYYEVLDTLKSELMIADQDLSEFGLDIDLEKTFL